MPMTMPTACAVPENAVQEPKQQHDPDVDDTIDQQGSARRLLAAPSGYDLACAVDGDARREQDKQAIEDQRRAKENDEAREQREQAGQIGG